MKVRNTILYMMGLVLLAANSCEEQEIPMYKKEDAVIFFSNENLEYSLKGNTDEHPLIVIKLNLYGPVCDYDREVKLSFPDSSWVDAKLGEDYSLEYARVKAGEMFGEIALRVNALGGDDTHRSIAVCLEKDDNFSYQVKDKSNARVSWSEDYVRPANSYVWRSWFYFFTPSYSHAYHELLYDFFGPEIEASSYLSAATKDPDLIYRGTNWWYSSSRDFYNFIKQHDTDDPEHPYMHSSDYESYSSYVQQVGEGTRPDIIPTILSTLIAN